MDMDPIEAFQTVEMHIGVVQRAEPNEAARKPSYRMWIDFGPELGVLQSSAQITELYSAESLIGRRVIAATNLGSRRIAGFRSDVLVLGAPDAQGRIVLLRPDGDALVGGRVC